MALVQLPSELLLRILGYVGSQFFSQDVRRLAVSKRWYSIAWLILAEECHLTCRTLPRFLTNEEAFERTQTHLRSIDLLVAFQAPSHLELYFEEPWLAETNDRLTKLAVKLRRCPLLGRLHLVLSNNVFGLQPSSIPGLLSLPNLTTLELEVGYHSVIPVRDDRKHLCCCINALLPSLRRLRCRMISVCERLLEPLPTEQPLELEELILNLTDDEAIIFYGASDFPRRCLDDRNRDFSLVRDAVEAQATALAARMRNPRMVRIISYRERTAPSNVYAFDALSGRRSWFSPRPMGEWDGSTMGLVEGLEQQS
jgi:hypothetical protein